ncbi:hypothetical protein F4809DRAFT_646613 [Biscogniauxia mediterranea]|nr:hypothetical protein F4809DRAFT_646613 [Biscogniauxia mediterranea]
MTVTPRKGDVGVDDSEKENASLKRECCRQARALNPNKYRTQSLASLENPKAVQFTTPPWLRGRRILTFPNDEASRCQRQGDILYRKAGDPVPLCESWLRVSMRKAHTGHPKNRPWPAYREYFSTGVQDIKPGEVYGVDVKTGPKNVVVH